MPRNRFELIKRYLHFADNEHLPTGDKIAKVRPLFEELNRVLLQFGVIHPQLSIDEQMVPYFGRHSSKMFMKGKPVRFGFKLWVLASSDGYPYQVEMYTGKNAGPGEGRAGCESLGLGGDVVLRLLECLQTPAQHHVFFDNYFSSYALMIALRQRGIRATGTVRDNRLKKCPLPDNKTAEKAPRGQHWYQSTNGVLAVKWRDNRAVTVVTNHSDISPLKDVQRWSGDEKKKVTVKQPNLIYEYNQYMGGVDLVDGAVGAYRPVIRWKKWYGTLVTNAFGLLRVASWRMYRSCTGRSVDQLVFTREVALELLKTRDKSHVRQTSPAADQDPAAAG
ncbi:piggyBac transposable element-derived protein 3-like [Amphibalanus amphitrite]|uniref:piggyBac transposable element-derived protein 3-like n=1 Tax=Amphibalanus amphitrite TaxID=1232801 RepID=UPI001C9181F5|nr:piggyBac transposable element-derived protein 3-like [Amphibalanus amphitrite]